MLIKSFSVFAHCSFSPVTNRGFGNINDLFTFCFLQPLAFGLPLARVCDMFTIINHWPLLPMLLTATFVLWLLRGRSCLCVYAVRRWKSCLEVLLNTLMHLFLIFFFKSQLYWWELIIDKSCYAPEQLKHSWIKVKVLDNKNVLYYCGIITMLRPARYRRHNKHVASVCSVKDPNVIIAEC